MARTPQQQLVHFLSDMYSVEQQALVQMASAPDVAGVPALADDFRQHYTETQQQADSVQQRLEALGGSPSTIKDAIMKLGGKSFLLFARMQPETPGRLLDHAYAYEAMEWAGYEMLKGFAHHAGDRQTVETARVIGEQEHTMMQRLEQHYDAAVRASHAETPAEELPDELRKHLAEVHAFERQGISLLEKAEEIGGNAPLDELYRRQLQEIQAHARLVEQRLDALGSDPSAWRDAALGMGGSNWGLFFQAQSDTPAKLAAFVYAVLHLEIGGYELLQRTARLVNDAETQQLCQQIIAEKRAGAQRLAAAFDTAVAATLEAVQ
jgi:ferritin-like metal-binding protein YciE